MHILALLHYLGLSWHKLGLWRSGAQWRPFQNFLPSACLPYRWTRAWCARRKPATSMTRPSKRRRQVGHGWPLHLQHRFHTLNSSILCMLPGACFWCVVFVFHLINARPWASIVILHAVLKSRFCRMTYCKTLVMSHVCIQSICLILSHEKRAKEEGNAFEFPCLVLLRLLCLPNASCTSCWLFAQKPVRLFRFFPFLQAAYMKILESSQTLLHVLKRETVPRVAAMRKSN